MKQLKYIYILFAVLLLASCVKSELEVPAEKPVPDGMVRVRIKTNYSGFQKPTTRSDNSIDNDVWVFVLDKEWNDILTEKAINYEVVDKGNGIADIEVLLPSDDDMIDRKPFRVVMLVNAPATFNNGVVDKSFSLINFGAITDYTDLKEKLNTVAIDVSGIEPNAKGALPMSGISEEFTVQDVKDNKEITINLTRIAAKVDVKVDSKIPTSQFEIEGISICNAPQQGCFFAPTSYPDLMRKNSGGLIDYSLVDPGQSLYVYESREDERTAIIVKAKYNGGSYYYRLGIDKNHKYSYNDINGALLFFDVNKNEDYFLRNCAYTYTITDVNGKGYASYEDAKAGGASNKMGSITASIDVTDLSSHDIVDNGEYYLGLTNSEYLLYADNTVAITGLTIATFNHTAPTTAIIGSVTGVSDVVIVQNRDGVSWDMKATMPAGFDKGEVTVIAGGLYKKINIFRKPAIDYGAHSIPFIGKYYVYGEIKDMNGNWMSLASHEDFDKEGSLSLAMPEGGLFINVNPNIGKTNDIEDGRSADVYLSRYDNSGRLKVHIAQKALDLKDINDEEESLPFDPIIGAFWKKDQTGERLIRIGRPNGGELDGYWFATIIQYGDGWNPAGGDGVLMDTEMTIDRNVGWRDGAVESQVANGNDSGFDKTYYVPQNKTVQGYLSDEEDGIYFRIGLQEKLPARLNARYAVVLLIYTYTPQGQLPQLRQQRIFLRQGDDADYLYGTTTKWMPYNLTDPSDPSNPASSALPTASSSLAQNNRNMTLSGRTSGNGRTDHWSNGPNVAKFCDYPSQGGYFFSFRERYSFNPIVYQAGGEINTLTNPNNDLNISGSRKVVEGIDYDDVCPNGYRTPRDYISYSIPSNSYQTNTPIMNTSQSEVRSSLFKFPNGYDRPTNSAEENADSRFNQCRDGVGTVVGVYADGFMDRRKLTTPRNNGSAFYVRENSAVALGTTKASYIGRLLFNETTYASLFFPYAGSFVPNSGMWAGSTHANAPYFMGEHAVYGTSTDRTEFDWWLNGYQMIYIGYARGEFTDSNNVFHKTVYVPQLVCVGPFTDFSLANIRCIKDNTSGGN